MDYILSSGAMLLIGARQRGKQEKISRIKRVRLFCGDLEYRYDDVFAAFCGNLTYITTTDCNAFVRMIVLNTHDEKLFIFIHNVDKYSGPLHMHEI